MFQDAQVKVKTQKAKSDVKERRQGEKNHTQPNSVCRHPRGPPQKQTTLGVDHRGLDRAATVELHDAADNNGAERAILHAVIWLEICHAAIGVSSPG